MNLRIDRTSEVPISRQLSDQIIFLIVTERLGADAAVPSTRDLARRLKIHHNTVSRAYHDLVQRRWLRHRRGGRLTVMVGNAEDEETTLDGLIDRWIAMGRSSGYSLEALRDGIGKRLHAEPPDHVLVVERAPDLRDLLCAELRAVLPWRIEGCGQEELASNSSRTVRALAVAVQHAIGDVAPHVPRHRPVVPIRLSDADALLENVRALRDPSVIAIVSTSRVFLDVARGVLAATIGNRHAIREILVPHEEAAAAGAADLVFCDSVAYERCPISNAKRYKLLDSRSIDDVRAVMESYQTAGRFER